MTTGDAVALFLSGYFGINQRSAKTKSAYTIDLTQFRDFIGTESLLESVAPQNLEAWAAQLQAKPYGIASIRRKIASARVFFGYWVRRGTLSTSPLWKLRFTLGRTRVLPRSLSAADSELLIREAWRRYKITCTPQAKQSMAHVLASRDLAVVESLFATGMRVGELSKLNLPDWLPVDSSFHVHGKGGRERLSFLPDDRSVSALVAYLALRHKLGEQRSALFEFLWAATLRTRHRTESGSDRRRRQDRKAGNPAHDSTYRGNASPALWGRLADRAGSSGSRFYRDDTALRARR